MKKQICTGLILFLFTFTLFGQDVREELEEKLSENAGEEADITTQADIYDLRLEDPLNINRATEEQLRELKILNDFQIAVLLDYRRKSPLLTVNELLYMPGFREEDVRLLAPFVFCGRQGEVRMGKHTPGYVIKQQALIRYGRIVEEQAGYKPLSDSVREANPNKSHYTGSPDKLHLRYTLRVSERIDAGMVMEKDAGEDFFRDSNPRGFDLYSFHFRYHSHKSLFREITFGDYHIRAGQGLLLWTSSTMGKSSDLCSFSRSAPMISGNRSTEENRFMRGTAVVFGKEKLSCTTFFSLKSLDASPDDSGEGFKGFLTSGLHNTPSSVQSENYVRELLAGTLLSFRQNRIHLNLNSFYQQFDCELSESDHLYKTFDFSGSRNTGISCSYRFLARKLQFFGEMARSNSSFAGLSGVLLYLHSGLTAGMLYRNYPISYSSFYANAFSEGSRVNNEQGFCMGLNLQTGKHTIRCYADIFSFPWLRYRTDVPSQGYEVKGDWGLRFGKLKVKLRGKMEQKAENEDAGEKIHKIIAIRKQNLGVKTDYEPIQSLLLQNRIEYCRYQHNQDSLAAGYLVCQDLVFNKGTFQFSGRLAWFNAENYNTRIYVYERGVIYSGGSTMHYGKGWRIVGVIKWKFMKKGTLGMKLGMSLYPGEESIGSGLNEIRGNHKTEIRIEMRMGF